MAKIINESKERLQSEFEDPYDMMERASRVLDREMKTILCYDSRNNYFESTNMGYPPHITIRIDGVYENGIVYELFCHPDAAAGAYDIPTSAKIVIVDGREPEFIINCTQEQYGQVEERMGKRIDSLLSNELSQKNKRKPLLKSLQKKQKELHDMKVELLEKEIELRVKSSIIELMKIEKERVAKK